MGGFDTSFFIGAALAFLIGVPLSKAVQAMVAKRLGDLGPRSEGRTSFGPGRHIDALSLILALLLAVGRLTVTWGKPITFNPFSNRFQRKGVMLCALMGPLTFFALTVVSGLILRTFATGQQVAVEIVNSSSNLPVETLYWFAAVNALLGAFSLIPIYPLDGYNIFFKGLFPAHWEPKMMWMETYGVALLLVFTLLLPFFIRINLAFFVATPIASPILMALGLPGLPV
jgi:Zn-dependent protease